MSLVSNIIDVQSTDQVRNSRADINTNFSRTAAAVDYVSGQVDTTGSADINYLSGAIDDNSADITYISGEMDNNSADITYISGEVNTAAADDIAYLSGAIDASSADIAYLSGGIDDNSSAISLIDDDIDYLSGEIDTNSGCDFKGNAYTCGEVYLSAIPVDLGYFDEGSNAWNWTGGPAADQVFYHHCGGGFGYNQHIAPPGPPASVVPWNYFFQRSAPSSQPLLANTSSKQGRFTRIRYTMNEHGNTPGIESEWDIMIDWVNEEFLVKGSIFYGTWAASYPHIRICQRYSGFGSKTISISPGISNCPLSYGINIGSSGVYSLPMPHARSPFAAVRFVVEARVETYSLATGGSL